MISSLPMSKLSLFALLAGMALSGCFARGGAAEAARSTDDAEEEEDLPELAPGETVVGPADAPPGQTEVAWEDNGIPIRQLKGDGKPHELKVPDSKVQKKGKPVAAK